ncbi:MAG: hypothetical protein ACR2MI_04105, partial [Flavobacteriaceae bacterium]
MKIRNTLFFIIVIVLGQKGLGQTTMATPTLVDGVYQIGTLAELSWITQTSSSWTSSFVLTADIDAYSTSGWDYSDDNTDGDRFNDTNDGTTSLGGNEGWLPIGTSSNRFMGNFDGKDFTIDAIYISNSSILKVGGLFGYVGNLNTATIENITLDNLSITNSSSSSNGTTGGLIGHIGNSNVTVKDIEIRNASITGVGYVGGVVGKSYTHDPISNNFVEATISGKNWVGGVMGYSTNGGSVVNNTSSVTISANGSAHVGGIAGQYELEDNNKFNSNLFIGSISASSLEYVGGLIGEVESTSTSHQMKFNAVHGSITGGKHVGGFIGGAPSWQPDSLGSFYNNISSATVVGTASVDAVIGSFNSSADIYVDFYKSSIFLNSNSVHTSTPSGFNIGDFNSKLNYTGYDNWSSSIFDNNFVLDSDIYNFAVPKGNENRLSDFYVKNVRSITSDGYYGTGETIQIQVLFSQDFTLNRNLPNNTPTIYLNSASPVPKALYTGTYSPTIINSMIFEYTVDPGEETPDLNYVISPSKTIPELEMGTNTPYSGGVDLNYSGYLPGINSSDALAQLSNIVVNTSNPTVTLSDTDDDNLLNISQTVTITAGFSEAMTATPVISISGVGTSSMVPASGTTTWTHLWDTSIGSLADGSYTVTVSGSDLATNPYTGTDSLTFVIDSISPTVILTDTDADNIINVSQNVTLTAAFNESMTATPTISISGLVTDVLMTPVAGTNSYTYALNTALYSLTDGATHSATVSGTDLAGNAYTGTNSITFTVTGSCPTTTVSSTPSLLNPSDPVSQTNPYLVSNLNELLWVAEDANSGSSSG